MVVVVVGIVVVAAAPTTAAAAAASASAADRMTLAQQGRQSWKKEDSHSHEFIVTCSAMSVTLVLCLIMM